ncbi:MAG: hypothetical protein EXR51_10410 [Dehalococcoidia bacterium]|nr:hypothetical protein [Dehalococcoidia bacterium]
MPISIMELSGQRYTPKGQPPHREPRDRHLSGSHMPSLPDHYQALQVHPAAEPEVVQAAYRRLCLKYYPGVYKGADAHQRMSLLNQAYAVLGDPEKRRAYDRQLSGISVGAGSAPTGRSSTVAQPQLLVTPTRVNFGPVAVGCTHSASLRISSAGRGRLTGLVTCKVPWMTTTPAEFSGNEVTVTIRFQPGIAGQFSSDRAVEVYSNGGRATVQVQGVGSGESGSQPVGRQPQHMPVGPAPQADAKNQFPVVRPKRMEVGVPFLLWVTVGAAITGLIWFQVAPILAAIPLGYAGWLAWRRLFLDRSQPDPVTPAAQTAAAGAQASEVRDGCAFCGAPRRPGLRSHCAECGGGICAVCGECPCGAHGGRVRQGGR